MFNEQRHYERPHQALGYQTPQEVDFALAEKPACGYNPDAGRTMASSSRQTALSGSLSPAGKAGSN